MTSQKQYPTSYLDPNSLWSNDAYADGPEDNNCASCRPILPGLYSIRLTNFGFNIPLNAIIDNVYINLKGVLYDLFGLPTNSFLGAEFCATRGASSACVYGNACAVSTSQVLCSQTTYAGEYDVLPSIIADGYSLAPSDFNNETFQFWIAFAMGQPPPGRQNAFVDAGYIRVVYHMGGVKRRLLLGEGL
jgi:hypothetical protein